MKQVLLVNLKMLTSVAEVLYLERYMVDHDEHYTTSVNVCTASTSGLVPKGYTEG